MNPKADDEQRPTTLSSRDDPFIGWYRITTAGNDKLIWGGARPRHAARCRGGGAGRGSHPRRTRDLWHVSSPSPGGAGRQAAGRGGGLFYEQHSGTTSSLAWRRRVGRGGPGRRGLEPAVEGPGEPHEAGVGAPRRWGRRARGILRGILGVAAAAGLDSAREDVRTGRGAPNATSSPLQLQCLPEQIFPSLLAPRPPLEYRGPSHIAGG